MRKERDNNPSQPTETVPPRAPLKNPSSFNCFTHSLSPSPIQTFIMGIEITTLVKGDGINYPKRGDTIMMHYVGTVDGKEFDNSRSRQRPLVTKIGVGAVIKGWDEGIPRLSVGERALLVTSPDFAYGEKGFPPTIPPNSTLRFDVELIKIN
ncbi:uncharacterized protein EI90DRAFT_3036259 [Cantharellus anzutake]|uniref:uncharacterized protein n=1 Tax=Cantharellus anzutake TaxID=1750568 RepID=UPI001904F3F4|nr:uncharacterized protein EI90DRAFT_3036259 [Cantharellus anzutake]KAF8340635.1 hypothetical protein EI90DRAFT_3036259 [Cantharellus anzutake]